MPTDPQKPAVGQQAGRDNGMRDFRLTSNGSSESTSGGIGLPRPVAAERVAAHPAREPDPDQSLVFPFIPRNAHYVARRAMFDASVGIERASSRQADAQEEANAILERVESRLPDRGMIQTEIARQFQPIVDELKTIGNRIQALDHGEVDHVVALVGAVVETSGKIVDNNNGGKWIINAWRECKQKPPEPSICDIANLKGKPETSRRFVAALLATADGFPGIAQKISGEDLRRFIRLSQGLCDVIGAPVPAPGPAAQPDDTKDPPAPA